MAELLQHHPDTSFKASPRGDAPEQNWYALRTLPRHEKQVDRILREKAVTTFLPLVSELHEWNDRRRLISTPLFPCYLFVRTAPVHSLRVAVLRTRGVIGFVGNTGAGTTLPDQQIQAVRAVIDSGVFCCPHPFLAVGQRVRIVGGSLNGIEGILQAKNHDHSVVISVNLIQNSLAVRVTGYRLVPIG
jgi:transcription antitermination factor NusG